MAARTIGRALAAIASGFRTIAATSLIDTEKNAAHAQAKRFDTVN
jgi:hypothetical protein